MRIGELAALSGVSQRSLRYYEQQGLIAPTRTPAGHRTYDPRHAELVARVQELFAAGFCSTVIRDLLPAVSDPHGDASLVAQALQAARTRLESEKHAIEGELAKLEELRTRLGLASEPLAPDTHVTVQGGRHDHDSAAATAPFDHRDRRLR